MSGRRSPLLNFVLLALINLLWAAQYPAYKTASNAMAPAALGFWTFLLAAVLLVPFLARERRRLGTARPRGSFPVSQFVLLAVFGLLPPAVLMAWGIERSTASNASILALTIPILMVVMAIAMLGEKLTSLRAGSIALALAGTVLISMNDIMGGNFRASALAGNVLMVLAGAGSAFYNTYSKKLLGRFTELEVLVFGYAIAAVFSAAVSVSLDRKPFYVLSGYGPPLWISLLVLGGVSWGLAMVIWMWILKRLEATQVAASIYLLPLFGVLLSVITLHERLRLAQVAGGVLVLAGTYLTSAYEERRAARMSAAR